MKLCKHCGGNVRQRRVLEAEGRDGQCLSVWYECQVCRRFSAYVIPLARAWKRNADGTLVKVEEQS